MQVLNSQLISKKFSLDKIGLKGVVMKNLLIFLSILTVVLLAAIDAKDRLSELDTIAGKTPAQVEIQDDILKPSRDEAKEEVNNTYKIPRTQDNLFNEKIKEQQNNNLPQQKQPNPLRMGD